MGNQPISFISGTVHRSIFTPPKYDFTKENLELKYFEQIQYLELNSKVRSEKSKITWIHFHGAQQNVFECIEFMEYVLFYMQEYLPETEINVLLPEYPGYEPPNSFILDKPRLKLTNTREAGENYELLLKSKLVEESFVKAEEKFTVITSYSMGTMYMVKLLNVFIKEKIYAVMLAPYGRFSTGCAFTGASLANDTEFPGVYDLPFPPLTNHTIACFQGEKDHIFPPNLNSDLDKFVTMVEIFKDCSHTYFIYRNCAWITANALGSTIKADQESNKETASGTAPGSDAFLSSVEIISSTSSS